jgi:hypothetical protein
MAKRKNAAAVALGRLGGRKGGRKGALARMAKMTPEERSAFARRAVQKRWRKTTAAQRSAFARKLWRIRRAKEKK